MTRYFMDVSEAAGLIIQAASFTQGGDIFMLEMGERIRVDDLARKMIRMRGLRPEIDVPIVYTGVRPGEKLHEELVFPDEGREPTEHPLVHRVNSSAPSSRNGTLHSEMQRLLELSRTGNQKALITELMRLAGRPEGNGAGPAAALATNTDPAATEKRSNLSH
jgi:FlaA1/EpsC-like NDP-sugar epimerase